jgi:hypothetical protein
MTHAENAILSKIPPLPPRPSVIAIAKGVLGDNLTIEHRGRYLLWRMGRWCPVNLDDVMRATNCRLKAEGRAQIELNPMWLV